MNIYLNNHEYCDSSWCKKKRKEDEVTIDVEIINFDKELNVNDNTETDTDSNNNFTRTTAGYYRSKAIDKDIYKIMLTAYSKYI